MAASTTTIGQLNSDFFDSIAKTTYSEDWVRALVHQISTFLSTHMDWIAAPKEQGLRVLDYACGGGIVSVALAPYASLLRGIDVSAGMVSLYNANAARLALSSSSSPSPSTNTTTPDSHSSDKYMFGVQGNLLDTTPTVPTTPDFHAFDLIVMSMALHHIPSAVAMLRKLVDKLVPGGALVVVDWLPHGPRSQAGAPQHHHHHHHHGQGKQHASAATITHYGFDEAEMREMFEEAGMEGFGWVLHPERSRMMEGAGTNQLFFARGARKM